MGTDADPIVGNWYQFLDGDQKFEIVDVDEENGTVEIQYFDGNLDTFDLDEWHDMDIEAMESPEDWTGPVDISERDDLGYTETEMDEGEKDWPRRSRYPRTEPTEEEGGREELEEERPKEEPWEEE